MQKTWAWIFAAMFILPEVLWSPILTYVLPFFLGSSYKFRNSIIFSNNENSLLATLIIGIQLAGVALLTFILYKNKENLKHKNITLFLSLFIAIVTSLVFLLQLMLSKSDLLGL